MHDPETLARECASKLCYAPIDQMREQDEALILAAIRKAVEVEHSLYEAAYRDARNTMRDRDTARTALPAVEAERDSLGWSVVATQNKLDRVTSQRDATRAQLATLRDEAKRVSRMLACDDDAATIVVVERILRDALKGTAPAGGVYERELSAEQMDAETVIVDPVPSSVGDVLRDAVAPAPPREDHVCEPSCDEPTICYQCGAHLPAPASPREDREWRCESCDVSMWFGAEPSDAIRCPLCLRLMIAASPREEEPIPKFRKCRFCGGRTLRMLGRRLCVKCHRELLDPAPPREEGTVILRCPECGCIKGATVEHYDTCKGQPEHVQELLNPRGSIPLLSMAAPPREERETKWHDQACSSIFAGRPCDCLYSSGAAARAKTTHREETPAQPESQAAWSCSFCGAVAYVEDGPPICPECKTIMRRQEPPDARE